MRLLLFIMFLGLAACAKHASTDAGAVCTSYVAPYMVSYPDGVDRKSDVALCSDGQYKATYLAPVDPITLMPINPSSFEAKSLTVKLFDEQTGAPYYTTFANQ